ncbi:hypothetical protein E6Q11_04845 [Candidatus Dojkabacteria bacterium]|uniref:Uncharacterized protein n=1 Tax=Candidatus Dojkabacteria bacterium TaxID=2099670 RepID=A0A5C7J5Z9_9BACT|nr:MAG: hypothetical protein E6Q11_04845 [Candidatus Dojkabacteria bacterium]
MNRLKLVHDSSPESPRNWDNLGTMICFHRRYDLGDKHSYSSDDYSSWEEMKQAIIKEENPAVILPLYMYDHSGISISTSPFSCRWDSGQIGFILVSKKKALEEFGGKIVTAKLKERIEKILEGEVETYSQYVEGDVYGFQIVDEDDDIIDSCYGFYGSDHKESGMLEYIDHELLGLSSEKELEQLIDTLEVQY